MSDERETSLPNSHELKPLLNGNLTGNCDSGHQEDDSDSGESQNEHPETPEQTSNGSNTTGDRNVNHYQQPNNKPNGPVSHVSPIPDEKTPGRSVPHEQREEPRETDEIYLAEKTDGGGFAYTTSNLVKTVNHEDGDEKCTDSECDEPSKSFQDPIEMEPDEDASQLPSPQKSCCFGRSDSLEKKFEQLLFRIHYSRKREMEEILDKETERNQAKLLVMKDKEGSPCLMEAITRQSAECTEALLQRFKRLDPVFKLNCIEKKEALRSKDGKNLFHLGAEVNDTGVMDAIDMCHLKEDIVDEGDCGGTTPLIVACQRRNREMIGRLIYLKAKIDRIDEKGFSPIYLVAAGGCAETLRIVLVEGSRKLHDYWSLLRDKKYFLNKGTILQAIVEGETSRTLERCFYSDEDREQIRLCLQKELKINPNFVHQVCRTSLTDLLRLALDYKEDLLNLVDGDRMTPLMRATEARQLEVVKLILGRTCGKDTVSKTTEDGKTALLIACDEGYPEIVRCIMEKSDVQLGHCDSEEKNAFHYAAKHDEVLKVLIDVLSEREEYKEHLRKKDINGYIPLHIAAAIGSHKNVELLLNNGAPYDIKSRCGRSALHCSTNLQTVKALVEFVRSSHGEDAVKDFINAGDSNKVTSLSLVASLGRWQTVSYLLENGADMRGNQDNETPLHFAASSGCTKTVERLLKGNVIHQENRVGETAAMFAAVSGKTDALQLLLDKGARLWATSHSSQKRKTCLDWAVANKDSNAASLILADEGWREAMEKSPDGADGLLAEMVKVLPDVAIEVLNKCTIKDKRGKKCHDFFALQTVQEFKHGEQTKKEVTSLQALENMAKFSRDECLRHDVVQMFLKEKWTKCAKWWYMFALFLYSVFLVSLTTYIGLVRNGAYSHNDPCVIIFTGICVTFAGLSIIKEFFQLIHKKWEYFYHWTTYMEFVMYICVFIFLFPQSDKSNRQWQTGSIAIFLGWINFIGFLKKFPIYGIYIIMAKKIFVTFLKVFLPIGFFVMAFAMTFFVLFRNDATTPKPGDDEDSNGFETIPHSLVTAFAMMVGEVNYREVFLNSANPNFALIMLFLVIFLVLMTILIMNLLTGLAVGDTREVLRRAMTERRIKQAMLIVEMDKSLNKYPCLRADFMEPYEESSEEENCLTKLTKLLAKTVFPDVNMEKENKKKASFECHCSSLKADLDDMKATLEAMQKSLQENGLRDTITKRRKSTQLLNKSRSGHGGTL